MGEKIIYRVALQGVKTKEEWEDFLTLADDFANGWELESKSWVNEESFLDLIWEDGWRGGGCTCGEILKNYFQEWLDAHSHIKFEFRAEYVEQVPTEIVWTSIERKIRAERNIK
jgi:hypothetical protein